MDPRHTISAFLGQVRHALRRRDALRSGLYVLAALGIVALAAPIAALVVARDEGPRIGEIALLAIAAISLAGVVAGLLRPRRRWRSEERVARYVGRQADAVASDLLSAVELSPAGTDPATAAPRTDRFSPALVGALLRDTATRVEELAPEKLVSLRRLRPAAMLCAATLGVHLLAFLAAPDAIEEGWRRVLYDPPARPFGGAHMSDTPLVGDLHVTLGAPLYSGRAPVELPSSSGDFRALAGTSVRIRTTALRPTISAQIVFDLPDNAPDDAEPLAPIATQLDGDVLSAEFTVVEPTTYRFLLVGSDGKRRVEAVPHVVEIEPDTAPDVQLFAPADELDVASLKRIELAYIAEDDFGIDKIELVLDGGKGQAGDQQRKLLPPPESSRRTAQAKFLLDLAEVPLSPGKRVAYHLEVTDNDAVRGPNVGKSRSYYLRVFSPRERHEELVSRHAELLEKLLRNLGGRLVVAAEDVRAHQVLRRETTDAVLELGGLVAALKDDPLALPKLVSALEEMHGRLEKLDAGEAKLLDKLAERQSQGGNTRQTAVRLAASDKVIVAELEDDVLELASWLDRQRMENQLAIFDEIQAHKERLRELFKEYERTGDDSLRAEIDRELRALEQKLDELMARQGAMNAEVLDRFVNMEAIERLNAIAGLERDGCLDQVRALLADGKLAEAQKQMEKCSKELDRAASDLEKSLSELRGDRFSEQERRFEEVMNDLADLAQDQGRIAEDADDIFQDYAQRADDLMRDKAKETRRKLSGTLEKLRKRLRKVPQDGLTAFSKEELDVVEKRLDDVDEMLADGDIAEALAMARQAKEGLETIRDELGAALEEDPRAPWSRTTREAQRAIKKAMPLADKLVEELESSTPSPREIMTPRDRSRLDRLRKRQKRVEDRTKRLAKKAAQHSEDLPGNAGEEMAQQLEDAQEQMARAKQRMRAQDPSGARQEARGAAEKLERAQQDARGAARMQMSMRSRGLRDEPVRIPGADEYKAPEKFREDILEAMRKETAPAGFRELVKRYYEELIR